MSTSAGAMSTWERLMMAATALKARNVNPRAGSHRKRASSPGWAPGDTSAARLRARTIGMSMKFAARGNTGATSVKKRTRTRAAIEASTSRSPVRSAGERSDGAPGERSLDGLGGGGVLTASEGRNDDRDRPVCSSSASAYGDGSTSPFSSRSISHRDTPSRSARAFSVRPAALRASQTVRVRSGAV
jgi:hypothetical protein